MTTEGFGTGWPHPDPAYLFFSIPKLISFKKLNGSGGDRKILKPVPFTFDFCFYFLFLIFYIYLLIFIILKLIYFLKIKNIMNFYKLFIKKHSNYYYYYLY